MHKQVIVKMYKDTEKGVELRVLVPSCTLLDLDEEIHRYGINGLFKGELRIDDGRKINAEQRKRAYATIADIATYTGEVPEQIKEIMK